MLKRLLTPLLFFTLLSLLLPQSLDAKADGESHRIRFTYSVKNKSATDVEEMSVVVARPVTDESQTVSEFFVESSMGDKCGERADQYGQTVLIFSTCLGAGETRTFGYSCKVDFHPRVGVPNREKAAQVKDIPPEIVERYTDDIPRVYALNNPVIKTLAKEFLTRYPNPLDRCVAVHRYVAKNITFRDGDTRDYAPSVIGRRVGTHSEFAYLFSSVLRGTGIPTRLVSGTIMRRPPPYTDTEGHRWPEVYLAGSGWVPFDPCLDSAKPAQMRYAAVAFRPAFVTTRSGGSSSLMGNSYTATTSNKESLTRLKSFNWMD